MKYGLFCLIEAKTNPYLTATQMKNEWMKPDMGSCGDAY